MVDITKIYLATEFVNKMAFLVFSVSVLMYLGFSLIRSQEDDVTDLRDFIVVIFKALAYTIFAFIVYVAYKNQMGMDIITVFSFLFSSLESAHNISIVIERLLLTIIKSFEKNKILIIIIMTIIVFVSIEPLKYFYSKFEKTTEKFLVEAVLIHERNIKDDEANNTITDKNKIDKIGKQYSKRRKELGLSNKEIANKTGIEEDILDKYEDGKFKKIEISDLNILANALEITPGYLLGWVN